jgi:YD repeat-containing protein
MRFGIFLLAASVALTTSASATETVTYNYDARGRLIHVARAGSVNSGIATNYQFDKADNRLTVTTTGGSGTGKSDPGGGVVPVPVDPAPGTTVVLPLNGYRILTVPSVGS